VSEELNKIDEIEKKYSEERKLTEDIAEEILSEEIRHCLKTNAFDEAGNYQQLKLKQLKKPQKKQQTLKISMKKVRLMVMAQHKCEPRLVAKQGP